MGKSKEKRELDNPSGYQYRLHLRKNGAFLTHTFDEESFQLSPDSVSTPLLTLEVFQECCLLLRQHFVDGFELPPINQGVILLDLEKPNELGNSRSVPEVFPEIKFFPASPTWELFFDSILADINVLHRQMIFNTFPSEPDFLNYENLEGEYFEKSIESALNKSEGISWKYKYQELQKAYNQKVQQYQHLEKILKKTKKTLQGKVDQISRLTKHCEQLDHENRAQKTSSKTSYKEFQSDLLKLFSMSDSFSIRKVKSSTKNGGKKHASK